MDTSDLIAQYEEGRWLYACTWDDFSVVLLCREFGTRWIPLSLFVGQLSIFCLWSSSSLLLTFQPSLFSAAQLLGCQGSQQAELLCFFLSLCSLIF